MFNNIKVNFQNFIHPKLHLFHPAPRSALQERSSAVLFSGFSAGGPRDSTEQLSHALPVARLCNKVAATVTLPLRQQVHFISARSHQRRSDKFIIRQMALCICHFTEQHTDSNRSVVIDEYSQV